MSRTRITKDSRNNFICVENAYAIKDILKNLGFRFNGNDKEWYRTMPSGIKLGCLLCDIFVAAADMDIYDLTEDLERIPGAWDAIAKIDVDRQKQFAEKGERGALPNKIILKRIEKAR